MNEEQTTTQETNQQEATAPEIPAQTAPVPEEAASQGDFFDLMGDEGKKFKKEEKKTPQKGAAGQTVSKGAAAKPPAKKWPAGMELRHSGHKLELPNEMTEEEIYAFLEDDFPEVSKDRAEIRHDKDKNRLYVVPKAHKKGLDEAKPLTVLREPPQRGSYPPVFRLLGKDGVYEVRKTRLGTFISKIPCDLEILEGFYPSVPKKCPASILAKVVRIFGDRPDVEALVNVVYDRRDESFHLVWVDHAATPGSVEYDPLPETDDVILYAEIHSHHRMRAFFSATDDEHEKRSGVYGVIGRVADPRPEALFRYSCGGIFGPLPAERLFDDPVVVDALVTQPQQ